MKSSWTKLGISVGFIATVTACTVTTGPFVPDEGGTSDASKDTGPAPGDGGTCSLVVTLNNATCTSCLQTNCCESVNACFRSTADGGDSDCSLLQSCINTAIAANSGDGGDAGAKLQEDIQLCRDAHPASVGLEQAWVSCLSAHCKTDCQ